MIARSEWKSGQIYTGYSQSGHAFTFDATPEHTDGPSPMEAVLAALCACTSVDVISILQKKRQPVTSLVVSAEAQQSEEPPRVYNHIVLTYTVGGALNRKAVEDAVALSKNKYCSVSAMLETTATIEFRIHLKDVETEATLLEAAHEA